MPGGGTALLFLVALLLGAPAGARASEALLYAPNAQDVALAGSDVVVARTGNDGRVSVDAMPASGGPARRLLSAASPGQGWAARVEVAASPERVGTLVVLIDDDDDRREWRIYTGSRAGPLGLALQARWRRGPLWVPLKLDVDGSRVAVAELRIPRLLRSRMRVLGDGTAEPVPWSGAGSPPIAVSGERAAFLGSASREHPGVFDRVFVVDRSSGAVAASIDVSSAARAILEDDLDLRADGRVVAAVDGRLLTAAPGESASTLFDHPRQPLSTPQFAGDRVAALAGRPFEIRRPVVLDPGARTARAVGTPSSLVQAMAANEHGVAWLASGCVLFAPLDASAPAEPPPGPCPRAEVTLAEGEEVLRGRTIRIRVTCVAAPAPGCRGTASLRAGRVVGRGRFLVPAGQRQTVEVVLTRGGLARVRRAVRREGKAVLRLGARVRAGHVSWPPGKLRTMVIDRIARRRTARPAVGPAEPPPGFRRVG